MILIQVQEILQMRHLFNDNFHMKEIRNKVILTSLETSDTLNESVKSSIL